jgi:hypothetical protein
MTNEYGCDTIVEGTFSGNITNATPTIQIHTTPINDYINNCLYPSITTSTCVINGDYASNATSTNDSSYLSYNGTNWEYNNY